MDILPPMRLRKLHEQRGNEGMDRIRYATYGTGKRQPSATNITNTVIEKIQLRQNGERPDDAIADILRGVSHLAVDSRQPINTQRLFNILVCIPIINTREIQRMLDLPDRQCRRYLQAIQTAMPFLEREILKKGVP